MTTNYRAAGVTYDAALNYDGIPPDRTPSLNLRLQVAFSTSPDDPSPAWVDLTSRLQMRPGIRISVGRGNEWDQVQTGSMSLVLDNTDGALTPELTSSPYSPNVLPARRCRLSYRNPSNYGQGNLIAAEDASFEGGTIGSWNTTYFGSPAPVTLANSTTHPSDGTKGLLITYPTAAAGAGPQLYVPTVIGRTYTARCVVWVAVGTPAVKWGGVFDGGTVTSTTTGAFETLTVTWTATASSAYLSLRSTSATTAGQQCWVDAIMMDEGATLGAFTTAAPVIRNRHDGYVDEWPAEWSTGSDQFAETHLTSMDIMSRIGARQKLRSVVVETMALDTPRFHYPLGEPAGSTTVSDVTPGNNGFTLSLRSLGAGGGTVTFGTATGVPTDGAAAPQFAPASSANGWILFGAVDPINPYAGDLTFEVAYLTSTMAAQTVAAVSDVWGNQVSIETDAAGNVVGRYLGFGSSLVTVTSTGGSRSDGQTHHVKLALSASGGTVTLALAIDGVDNASGTETAMGIAYFTQLSVGGSPYGAAQMFTGTVCHVAGFSGVLATSRALEHRTAQTTGFANERTDQRLSRICSWAGVPTSRQLFDVGKTTTVAHHDCTGDNPLDYMRKVVDTEAGLLFADGSGNLVFYNRARSYSTQTAAFSIPAHMLGEDTRMVKNLQLVGNDVTGSRSGGVSVHMVDTTSTGAYGYIDKSLDLLTTSDDDVRAAVGWRLNTSKDPDMRFSNLKLDAFTDPTYSPAILAGMAVGARMTLTGMPSQAPASTIDQLVQGYTETITDSSWEIDVNSSPYGKHLAMVFDDPTYGQWDAGYFIVY